MSSTARPSKIVARPGTVAPLSCDARSSQGNYRDRALLDLAHGVQECTLQLPGVCAGHSAHGCEPAHSNSSKHGKGLSIKAHDSFHAAGCHACHAEIDQGSRFSREEKEEFMRAAIDRTLLLYWKRGWIAVTEKGRKHRL